MKKNDTIKDLIDFAINEKQYIEKYNNKEFSPSKKTINFILNYSKVLSVVKSRFAGKINFIMN